MPMLDVTDVLLDPDFMDTSLSCARNAQTVGNNGLAVDSATNTRFAGVVTSDTGDLLQRLAEGSYVKGSISIITKFALIDGTTGNDADVVTWNGRKYTVTSVNDYSTYGAGFVEAICQPLLLSGG